jgi:hypothetical protein
MSFRENRLLKVALGVVMLFAGDLPVYAGIGDSVKVTIVTKTHNGEYAPKNATMIWIQTVENVFVKTILKSAQNYIQYCLKWNSISGGDVDGLTGASRNDHSGSLTGVWDCTDQNGQPVPDGSYQFWVEMTENNGAGKTTSGTIIIDGASKTVNGKLTPYFPTFSAVYIPASAAVHVPINAARTTLVSMAQTAQGIAITFKSPAAYSASLLTPSGKLVSHAKGYGNNVLLGMNKKLGNGMYIVEIIAGKTKTAYRFIKN